MEKEKILARIGEHLPTLQQFPIEKIGVATIMDPKRKEEKVTLLLQFRKDETLEMETLRQAMDFLEKILPGDMEIIFGIGAENIDEMDSLDEADYILL